MNFIKWRRSLKIFLKRIKTEKNKFLEMIYLWTLTFGAWNFLVDLSLNILVYMAGKPWMMTYCKYLD